MSAVTPLPCPFCGGKATLMSYGGTWNFVSCVADECTIKPFSWGDTKASAIARWNTRAPVADPAAQPLAKTKTEPKQVDNGYKQPRRTASKRGVS